MSARTKKQIEQRKKEGFEGQRAIVIPRKILSAQCDKHPLTSALYVTDIGYYPKARFHYRERSHGADQHILIYCVKGKGTVKIKSSFYSIQAGEFFLIPRHEAHTYASDESDPWTIFWIHFKGSSSDAMAALALKELGCYKGFVNYDEGRIELFNGMYSLLQRGYGNENLISINMHLWQFLNTFIFAGKFDVSAKPSKHDLIERAIDFMSENIHEAINLDEVSQSANLSPSHFSFLFKKRTGFSPIEYFNHLKIQKACQFLQFSDMRIKEIAYNLGIYDPYYFSRLFRKVMGMSPVEYRERVVH
jgi:AraC-like DNA-binding protein